MTMGMDPDLDQCAVKALRDIGYTGYVEIFMHPTPRGIPILPTAAEITVQVRGAPRATGTDANAIQLTRDGVAAGLVGIPNRYMHSPNELVSLDDLDRAAEVIAETCRAVTADTDFTAR